MAIILILSKLSQSHKQKMLHPPYFHIAAFILYFGIFIPRTHAESPQWPSFLGAGKSFIEPDSIPVKWGLNRNKAWEQQLPGHGQSSPVIYDNDIFVTAISGDMKNSNHVLSLDLMDGSTNWEFIQETSNKAKNSVYISRAAPTPAVDKNGVYAFFESGDLMAISFSGEELWRRCLTDVYGPIENEFGIASSLAQYEEQLFVLIDDSAKSYLLAVSKQDGRTLWCSERQSRISWSSPAIVNLDNKNQVICSSAGSIDSYDPENGSLLWSYEKVSGNTVTTPVDYGVNSIFIGASVGRDGKNATEAQKSNMVLTAELTNGSWTPKKIWCPEKATSSFGSPIHAAGYVYWVNRAGVVFCHDFQTGKQCYSERLSSPCWATPFQIGDRIYFFGKNGVTDVIKTGPKFITLSTNELWGSEDDTLDSKLIASETDKERKASATLFAGRIQYGITAVTGSLVIRTGDKLFCIRRPSSKITPKN
ncbi:PQQ-like beta-propeller repeat protein [Pirellulales bacterium]|nr:PQQ-like beta-propeller repeat protein [Pirellulales bacterium]MDB4365298.1 PQQ-like beta-propeller repeat protein [Pirellulales bacterium]